MHIAVYMQHGRERRYKHEDRSTLSLLNKEDIKWPLIINLKKILTISVTILSQIHLITATVSVSTLQYG